MLDPILYICKNKPVYNRTRNRHFPEGEYAMRTQRVLFLFLVFVLFFYAEAPAANIAVLSNLYAAETAADFNSKLTGHSFTGIDVSSTTPTLAQLQAYDVVLLFEDGIFANA